ncbi:MAG: sigma-54-dependent Fis family transcriptional regulator [Magnetococcales bacterium]|nr:sigma-54-dependent Fis family transcriptional regulator [Magnetococcales bacterium]
MAQEGARLEKIPAKILIVDDEKNIRLTLGVCLREMGCEVAEAANEETALLAARQSHFDMAFVDLRLGAGNGLDLIPRLLVERPMLSIVVITAYATFETAVDAIKRGAADYLPKPFNPAQIRAIVERLSRRRVLEQRVQELEAMLRETSPEVELSTQSAVMRPVFVTAQRAAQSDAAILLRGENGTGKGVLARFIHSWSKRAAHPFVVVNCPTLSADLLASELFGHVRGAFTGAVRDQEGRVEVAEGGTVFLDELGEIPTSLQAKLLRFLQDKEFERVGENRTRKANVRLIAATNRNLEEDITQGRFREDLFFRINVIEIVVPPLRQRREDILPLAYRFLEFFARSEGRPTPELSPPAENALLAYAWPGNIRELKNVMERAAIIWPSPLIEPEAFPSRIAELSHIAMPQLGGLHTLESIEREHILRVIASSQTLEEAAAILGLDVSTLWRKRKRYQGEAS